MIRYLLLLISMIFSVCANAQVEPLPLMPWPQSVVQQQGQLMLGNKWRVAIDAPEQGEIKTALKRVIARVQQQTGQKITLKLVAEKKANFIITSKNSGLISNYIKDWDESYQLNSSAQAVTLSANHSLGILRGLETLLQLIGNQQKNIQLPLVSIKDHPRFKWRGLLLDTSRHFFSVNTIKRQIDAMAAAKYNIFHWHLTDDQGWRFESKKYPKLHKLASDGDFYTRAQIREVVRYARARGIQVLPEIDVPGHASAIAVAYPELMSAPGPYAMEYRWGVLKPLLNPANEKVYEFVDALVAEVAELFPFEYLHIGGDEVDPEHWNANMQIQSFMQEQGIKDARALQAYFNQRVQKILQLHQRKMIGWDEIQHKNLPNDIVIHSWRGPDGVSDAVSHGFQAILSTGYYLDQPQYASYHYRNDPIPPKPVAIALAPQDALASWRFEMPRKRGKPVTGIFSVIGKGDAARVVVDFTGKSRREAKLQSYDNKSARFSLDTWMGPVAFNVQFVAQKLQGIMLVGNAPYAISGEQIVDNVSLQNERKNAQKIKQKEKNKSAQKELPISEQVAHLSAQQEQLILGGEAALWAEIVDEHSIDLRLWPRAFVVGERLWSAQSLQDESSMYYRLNFVAQWAEKSVALQHKLQQQMALKRLLGEQAGATEIQALETFMQLLEPAHYYHRHHEKSVYESYSKADPLNRLVDALPVENEGLQQFNQRLEQWLINPAANAQGDELKTQLLVWAENRRVLESLLVKHPQWRSLADNADRLVTATILLLDKRAHSSKLPDDEREKIENLLHQLRQMDQEIIIALIGSLEKILYSFT